MTEKPIAWLEGLTDNVKGMRLELKGVSFLVGRAANAEIQLEDSLISREHARLSYADGQLTLQDLGSKHGTFVNGDKIETVRLKNGDRIRFGGSLFHLHVARKVISEMESAEDEIATRMASEDDVPTRLTSPDEVATDFAVEKPDPSSQPAHASGSSERLANCAHCGARLEPGEKFCGECGQPRAAGQRLASRQGEAARRPPPVAPPRAPGSAPVPFAGLQRSGVPRWVIAVLVGVAAIAVVAAGLMLVFNLLGGDSDELSPQQGIAAIVSPSATQDEAQATTAAAAPLLDASPLSTQAAGTPEVTEPEAEGLPDAARASATPGEAAGAEAVLGGASGLAFSSDRTGFPQIYYLDLASGQVIQLTDHPDGACQPAWSPDGQRLAYTSPCGSNREAYVGSNIFVMEVDPAGSAGNAQTLTVSLGGGNYDPDWSPDGSKIAFSSQRTGRPQVFTVGLDGQAPINLNDDLAHNWAPAWSPDGSQIAFLTGRGGAEEVWTVAAGGGEERRFSRSDGSDVSRPGWSPDGSTIVFEKVVGSIPRLIAAPVADGGVREVQVCQEGTLSLQPMGEPAWSPDGMWLAFETWPGGGDHKIAVMQINCTGYEELTDDPALDFDAAWRPAP